MNIIQLQPGDTLVLHNVKSTEQREAIAKGMRKVLPHISILFPVEGDHILRPPTPEATSAYLEALAKRGAGDSPAASSPSTRSTPSTSSPDSETVTPHPVFGDGPLRDYQITNHGHPLAPDPAIPESRGDLNPEELDARLVELAIGVPHGIDAIRDFASAVRLSVAECSNRYIIDYATHVFSGTAAGTPPAPAKPGTITIELELSEEEAACWWADVTWNGKAPRNIDSIVRDHVLQHLHKVMRHTIRQTREQALADFRKRRPS